MPTIHQLIAGILLLATACVARAGGQDQPGQQVLAATSRMYVTLVPRSAEPDDVPRWIDAFPNTQPSLNLSLRTSRRNRLEFSLSQQNLLADGDVLQLRMASDAHILAQLLSGGQFSEVDDSWIAVLGLASRLRLTYNNGPWELSLSAKRRFGDGDVRARISYGIRF